ncbi:hypothetical protein M885DRAFT_578735 [Pelagophyceae sp. CCMP2097]|nr:hypothetical protein M885DRAFT_578735 [Pelagophyceae sp. CCMP2097]
MALHIMALGLNMIAQAKMLSAARVRNRPDYMRHDTPAAYAVPPLRFAPGRESMLSVLLRDDAPADDDERRLAPESHGDAGHALCGGGPKSKVDEGANEFPAN